MKKLNQKGFSPFETVLLILVVIILGFAGYVVLQKDKPDTSSKQDPGVSTASKPETKTSPATDPTAGWTAYSNKPGHYNLKYPNSWATASSPEYCTDTLLLLGGDTNSVGKCATESFGQMAVDSVAGNRVADYQMSKNYYPDLVTESVTINGVIGQKQTGTFNSLDGEGGVGPEKGDKKTLYLFFANGRTYSATYNSYKNVSGGQPDVLSDFNTMVVKTLKFES